MLTSEKLGWQATRSTLSLPLPHRRLDDGAGYDIVPGLCLDGRYRLITALGQGSYGRVYRAEDINNTGRKVAVKVLNSQRARDPATIERFWHEGIIATQCPHPNLVTVHDVCLSREGIHYIVMELANGISLSELIKARFPLCRRRVVSIMEQLLAGLERMHAAGIVHVDVKSDNIMVHEMVHEGETHDLVRIVDFGLARAIESAPPDSGDATPETSRSKGAGQRRRSGIYGTPGYMAPEVIRGFPPTYASDVYAAGIVLYQMLRGRIPFKARTASETLRRQLEEPAAVLLGIIESPAIPEPLAAVLVRATSKDPEHRYQTVSAFRLALRQAEAAAALDSEFALYSAL